MALRVLAPGSSLKIQGPFPTPVGAVGQPDPGTKELTGVVCGLTRARHKWRMQGTAAEMNICYTFCLVLQNSEDCLRLLYQLYEASNSVTEALSTLCIPSSRQE